MVETNCTTPNTPNAPCSPCDSGCPIVLNDFCILYSGDDFSVLSIKNGDKLSSVIVTILNTLTSDNSANFTPLNVNTSQFTDSTAPEQSLSFTSEGKGWVTIRGRLVLSSQINTGNSHNVLSGTTSNLLPASITPRYNQKLICSSNDGTIYELQALANGYLKVYALTGNMVVSSVIDINFRYNIN